MNYHIMWIGFLNNRGDGLDVFSRNPAGNPETRVFIALNIGSGDPGGGAR